MSKHTPGPWTATMIYGRYCAFELQPASTRARDLAFGKDRSGAGCVEELKANGRLVEAAPELLEALRLAVTALRAHGVGELDGALLQCRAAIAKATGENT